MTDTTDTTTEAPSADASEEQSGGNREARYRVRAREAEAQRDTLALRVKALQEREVHRHLSAHLADPSDAFTLGGIDLDDLVDDDGLVDEAKVEQATTTLLTAKPHLAKRDLAPTFDGGARTTAATSGATWSGVLGGRS